MVLRSMSESGKEQTPSGSIVAAASAVEAKEERVVPNQAVRLVLPPDGEPNVSRS